MIVLIILLESWFHQNEELSLCIEVKIGHPFHYFSLLFSKLLSHPAFSFHFFIPLSHHCHSIFYVPHSLSTCSFHFSLYSNFSALYFPLQFLLYLPFLFAHSTFFSIFSLYFTIHFRRHLSLSEGTEWWHKFHQSLIQFRLPSHPTFIQSMHTKTLYCCTIAIKLKEIVFSINLFTSTWIPLHLQQRDLRACVVFSAPAFNRDIILAAKWAIASGCAFLKSSSSTTDWRKLTKTKDILTSI